MTTPSAPGSATGLLDQLGWDVHWEAAFADLRGTPARVARVDRGAIRALGSSGPVSATAPLDRALVTGDWVALGDDDGAAPAVAGLAPRRTALVRRDPAAEPAAQTLAANMHQVWVLHGAERPLRAAWLDRALVVAYGSAATPLIVLAKIDLARDPAAQVRAAQQLSPHTPVLATSAATGAGVDALAGRLHGGRCAALLGRSGAGKSALVNALTGAGDQATGQVRTGDARGRHTTTRRALVLAAGGSVIDTPGVRALGLWDAQRGLDGAFPDIAKHARECRFGDCSHRHEPGCGVRAAVADGALPEERYARYITLSE